MAESDIRKDDDLKTLLYRLMDYRIIHQVARSLTHKSIKGPSFQAFAVDVGCYAFMRNLQGRMTEVDLTQPDAKEQMRSGPVFSPQEFRAFFANPTRWKCGDGIGRSRRSCGDRMRRLRTGYDPV